MEISIFLHRTYLCMSVMINYPKRVMLESYVSLKYIIVVYNKTARILINNKCVLISLNGHK